VTVRVASAWATWLVAWLTLDPTAARGQAGQLATDSSLVAARHDSVSATTGWRPRRFEGAAVGTVHADTIVPTAPVLQFTDVVAGRLPGVEVQSAGGQIGSGARIIIRGVGSVANASDPVVYLDGVRIDASPGGPNRAEATSNGAVSVAPREGRLEDLNPGEIERVDVLSGPEATTRYGIDASNGVILVTTKLSATTQTQWSINAEAGELTVPASSETNSYFAWGHTTGSPSSIVHCPTLDQVAGSCQLDSLTHFSPLSTAMTTPFANGQHDSFGLQVRGGLGPLRYFVSGQRQNETGILEMPPADAELFTSQDGHGPLAGERWPNRLDRTNVRANASVDLGRMGTLTISANAIDGNHSAASENELSTSLAASFATQSIGNGWDSPFDEPRYLFALESTDRVERYIGGANWAWHPLGWLEAHADGGADHENEWDGGHLYGADATSGQVPGYKGTDHDVTRNYTGDVVVAATAHPWRRVSAMTSIGVQFRESVFNERTEEGLGLTDGSNEPIILSTYANSAETQQRGGFLEEAVSVDDRLFLTGAVRDDETHFAGPYSVGAAYPRLAISWSAVRQGADGLRLRTAYGESGALPFPFVATPLTTVITTGVVGESVALLHPERVREFEAGLDATAADARVTGSASLYDKTTTGAILPVGNTESNSGVIRNRGVEIAVGITVVRTPALSWSADINGWANENELVSANLPVSPLAASNTFGNPYYLAPGHALYSIWEPSLSYRDTNGDGIIEPDEVTLGPIADQGSSLPTRTAALHSELGILRDHIRIGALLAYSGGNHLIDYDRTLQLILTTSRGANDAHAPLAQQAEAVATNLSGTGGGPTYVGPVQDGSFVRVRELSVSYIATPAIARALHTGTATFSLLARNLWLWTRYTGVDPEINTADGNPGSTQAFTPQPRYFLARVTLGY
jgi:TonB-dependent SusC/RagA subfamily outer membrane receptor